MQRKLISFLLVALVFVSCLSGVTLKVTASDYQYAMFLFSDYLNVSNVKHDYQASAPSRKPVDFTGRTTHSNVIAPFDCKVVKIDAGYDPGNSVVIESLEKVRYPDGTVDYMSVCLTHDNDISDIKVGNTYTQGTVFYQTGTYGKVTGDHLHMMVGRGRYSSSGASTRQAFFGNESIAIWPDDAFFLYPGTTVRNGDGTYATRYGDNSPTVTFKWSTLNSIPIAPSRPTVTVNGNSATVEWNDVANETSYDVYLVQSPWGWEDIKYSKSVSANTTSCTFSNVAPGEYCAFIISRPNANNVQSPWASFSVLEETCTSHTKGDYLWYEAGHPHYKYWTCANCGATFTDGTTTYVSSCVSCNPEAGKPFYAWVQGTNGALAINDAPASSPNYSNQLGRIPEGCMCTVYPDKASGNWWWVEYNGVSGYAYSKYLTTSHTHKYSETVTAPKCTKQGFTTYACSCGYSYTGNFTDAIGHDWQLTSEPYSPTCEDFAFWSYNCARSGCLDCMIRIFKPLGHDYNDYIVVSYPNHNTSGEICGSCSRCESTDAIVIPNLNTTDYTYEVILQPSCKSNGYARYIWNQTAYGLFTFDVELQKLTHNYVVTTINPTCTKQGYTIHTCSYCGDSYNDSYVDALGHAWDEGTVTKWPTEYEEGEMTYTCTRCAQTKTESIPKSAHIHCYSIIETVEATCTEYGYTVGICESCGSRTAEYDIVEPLEHDWDTGTVLIYPTETEPGKKVYTCRRCGEHLVNIMPPYGNHEYGYCLTEMFTDAPGWTNWAHVGVDYVVEHGLFNGTSRTTFSPNSAMTRAMLVTVLWRYAGEPLEGENTFTDVKDDTWYTEAVAWAAHNEIVGGVGDGKFDPNGNITREQMAAILYRYCNSLGIDTAKRADLASFPDGHKVSAWAIDALSWANAEGLITGTQSGSSIYLDPQGNATRAQVATILMRFIENVIG